MIEQQGAGSRIIRSRAFSPYRVLIEAERMLFPLEGLEIRGVRTMDLGLRTVRSRGA